MVKGIEALKARLAEVYPEFDATLKELLAEEANRIVAQMNQQKPNPSIIIGWVWGRDVPKGVHRLGSVRPSASSDGPRITVYATATTKEYPNGFPAVATWFEFGTAERYHKSGKYVGKIEPQPYFYWIYRANRETVRRKIRSRIKRKAKTL